MNLWGIKLFLFLVPQSEFGQNQHIYLSGDWIFLFLKFVSFHMFFILKLNISYIVWWVYQQFNPIKSPSLNKYLAHSISSFAASSTFYKRFLHILFFFAISENPSSGFSSNVIRRNLVKPPCKFSSYFNLIIELVSNHFILFCKVRTSEDT
jgi:hypothetical protein